MEDEEEFSEEDQVENFRKSIARRVALESDKLVDVILNIVYDDEVEAKVKLSGISMLLDRGLPKLGIQHSKEEEVEERGSRKAIREEIERLMELDKDEEE
jgi:hypothetical protein